MPVLAPLPPAIFDVKLTQIRKLGEQLQRTCQKLVDGEGLLRIHERAEPEQPDGPGVDLRDEPTTTCSASLQVFQLHVKGTWQGTGWVLLTVLHAFTSKQQLQNITQMWKQHQWVPNKWP